NHRSRRRAGLSRGRSRRTRVRLVRLSSGLRSAGRGAREAQGGGQACRPRSAAEQAMTFVSSDAAARQAISEALDDTLVVEAAAGTGKTTELVNRVLRLLVT